MGLGPKNYYEILRIERNASTEEIRVAYKEIAKVYHPDSNFFDEIMPGESSNDTVDIFKRLTEAYNTLSNPERRKQYDEKLPQELPGWDDDAGDERFHTEIQKRRSSACFRPSEAFGTFGRIDESASDSTGDEDNPNLRGFASPHTPKMGFLRKILWTLGF